MRIFSISLMLILLCNFSASAADLSEDFNKLYEARTPLTASEKITLSKFDFYIIPGILSEAFLKEDDRAFFDFSFATKDYFASQLSFLKKQQFVTKQIDSSSLSVEEIRHNIREVINASSSKSRKAIFVSHSLSGLALLEELIVNEHSQDHVGGILFLQSPFRGAPVADLFLKYPYQSKYWLKPLLPFFNASEETIRYLSPEMREPFMQTEEQKINKLVSKIPIITISGVVNGHKSLFTPSLVLLKKEGIDDETDGMVPFKNSKLGSADFIKLNGVDHGELVVRIPHSNFNRNGLTGSLLKLLSSKISSKK